MRLLKKKYNKIFNMILNISSQGIFFEKQDCRSKRKLYAYGRGVGHGEEILPRVTKIMGHPDSILWFFLNSLYIISTTFYSISFAFLMTLKLFVV